MVQNDGNDEMESLEGNKPYKYFNVRIPSFPKKRTKCSLNDILQRKCSFTASFGSQYSQQGQSQPKTKVKFPYLDPLTSFSFDSSTISFCLECISCNTSSKMSLSCLDASKVGVNS